MEYDVVNKPRHYNQGGIECIDALKAATVSKTGIEAVCTANVIKYLWPHTVLYPQLEQSSHSFINGYSVGTQ